MSAAATAAASVITQVTDGTVFDEPPVLSRRTSIAEPLTPGRVTQSWTFPPADSDDIPSGSAAPSAAVASGSASPPNAAHATPAIPPLVAAASPASGGNGKAAAEEMRLAEASANAKAADETAGRTAAKACQCAVETAGAQLAEAERQAKLDEKIEIDPEKHRRANEPTAAAPEEEEARRVNDAAAAVEEEAAAAGRAAAAAATTAAEERVAQQRLTTEADAAHVQEEKVANASKEAQIAANAAAAEAVDVAHPANVTSGKKGKPRGVRGTPSRRGRNMSFADKVRAGKKNHTP